MKVILTEEIPNLGAIGSIVEVAPGYGRNFLIPQGIAVLATEGNKRAVAESKKQAEKKEKKKAGEASELAKRIENIPCTIPVKVGEEDKLFGSVGQQELVDFLKKEGFEVERRAVLLDDPIKQLGVYEVGIKLHRDVIAKLKVWVVKEDKA